MSKSEDNAPLLEVNGLGVTFKADEGTVRAVEDAILTRARQLRIQDGRL